MKSKKINYFKPQIKEKKLSLELFFNKYNPGGLVDLEGGILLAGKTADGSSCFTGDMKILMADKIYKKISRVNIGDTILSYDISKHKVIKNKIIKIKKHDNKDPIMIINKILKVTPRHHLFVKDKIFKLVKEIKVGDKLLDSKERFREVFSIKKLMSKEKVYNLILKSDHQTYFVEDYLVISGYIPL